VAVACRDETAAAAVVTRELEDLDAVELTWSCADDADSESMIYLVQSSTSTTGQHHPTRRRRRLRASDAAAADTAAWRLVAEVSSPAVDTNYYRLWLNRFSLNTDFGSPILATLTR